MKRVRECLAVVIAVLLLSGCSSSQPVTKTTTPASAPNAPATTSKPADTQPQSTAAPTTTAPNVDLQERLAQLKTFMKDNYTGTTWFSQFTEIQLVTSGTSATISVQTGFYPKDSNKESAKNACRGTMMGGVETLGTSKITVEILAQGGALLTRCWADVANGRLATPMQFNN